MTGHAPKVMVTCDIFCDPVIHIYQNPVSWAGVVLAGWRLSRLAGYTPPSQALRLDAARAMRESRIRHDATASARRLPCLGRHPVGGRRYRPRRPAAGNRARRGRTCRRPRFRHGPRRPAGAGWQCRTRTHPGLYLPRLPRRHRGQPDGLGRMARVRARGRGQRDVAPAPIYRPAAPRKALFMRVCQPGPLALNRSTTS